MERQGRTCIYLVDESVVESLDANGTDVSKNDRTHAFVVSFALPFSHSLALFTPNIGAVYKIQFTVKESKIAKGAGNGVFLHYVGGYELKDRDDRVAAPAVLELVEGNNTPERRMDFWKKWQDRFVATDRKLGNDLLVHIKRKACKYCIR